MAFYIWHDDRYKHGREKEGRHRVRKSFQLREVVLKRNNSKTEILLLQRHEVTLARGQFSKTSV